MRCWKPLAILWLLGCGGSGDDPAPARKRVKLSAPAETVLAEYEGGKFTAEELAEAAFQKCGPVKSPADADRAKEVLGALYRLKDSPSRAEAAKAVVEAVSAGLAGVTKADQESWDTIQRLAQTHHAGLGRAALQAWLRLDRPAAERAIFEESFGWLTKMPRSAEMWFHPAVTIAMARELDPARARKGLEAWLAGEGRKVGQSDMGNQYTADEDCMALLDLGATKESYKRIAAHPLVQAGPYGFVIRYAKTRRDRYALDDEDRTDILLAILQGSPKFVQFQELEPVIGKSFESSGEPLVKALGRFLEGFDARKQGIHVWEKYLTPSLLRLGEAETAALFRRVAGSTQGRVALRGFCRPLYGGQPASRAAIVRGYCEILGKDPEEDRHWFGDFRLHPIAETAPDLARALGREGVPLSTFMEGLKFVRVWVDPGTMLPAIRRAMRTSDPALAELLYALEGLPAEKLKELAPELVESFLVEGNRSGFRVRMEAIKLSGRPDAAPRLVAILRQVKGEETQKEILALLAYLGDKRVVKAIVESAPPGTGAFTPWHSTVYTLGGGSRESQEKLADYYARVRSRLPAQVAPIETPLGEKVLEARVVERPPPPPSSAARPAPAPAPVPAPAPGPAPVAGPARAVVREAPKEGPPGTLLYRASEEKIAAYKAVASNDLLFTLDTTTVASLDLLTGKVLWSATSPGASSVGFLWGSDDRVVASFGTGLVCHSKKDGARLWEKKTSLSILGGAAGGGVLAVSGQGVHAFDLETGRLAWKWSAESTNLSASFVLYGDADGILLQRIPTAKPRKFDLAWVDPKTGAERWVAPAEEGLESAHFARRHGDVLVVLRKTDTYELDLRTGKTLYEAKGRWIPAHGRLFRAVTGAGGFEIQDRNSGLAKWSIKEGKLWAFDDALCLYTEGKELVRAEPWTGKVLWRVTPDLANLRTSLKFDGVVVAHDLNEAVAIDLKTGKPLWKQGVPKFEAKGAAAVNGRAVFWSSSPLRAFAIAVEGGR